MKKLLFAILILLSFSAVLASCSCEGENGEHVHVWDGGKIIKDSTKTEYGIIEYTCIQCSAKERQILAKLNHDHQFSSEWRSDRMAHWHSCNVENCTILDSREEHKWDDGEVIKEANQQAAGSKKYKCTVCGYEKTERYVASPTVDGMTWNKAFEMQAFKNVTIVYTSEQNGYTNSVTAKVAGGKVEYTDESGKKSVLDDVPGIPFGSYGITSRFAFMQSKYAQVIYDSATKAYLFTTDNEKGSVQFSDGKITAFSIVKDGRTEKYQLSMYSKTVIEE